MNWQEFFYIVASIALIVTTLAVVSAFFLIIKVSRAVKEMAVQSRVVAQAWGKLAATRVVLRILKLIF